ncbi:hypothetical protein GCM10010400_38230 [Streptomyces aculeolatus]
MQNAEVEVHTGPRPGQRIVLVDEAGMRLVEDAAVAVGPQCGKAVAGDGFDAISQWRFRFPAGCRVARQG